MPPLKPVPTSTPTDEGQIHPFLQEVPPPTHADDCRSQSSVHFRILYLTLAIITVLEVCIVAFVASPHNAVLPNASNSEVHKKQELPDRFPTIYCNGTSELPFPLSSDITDASRFLVVCLEDDAVAFCREMGDGVLVFRCGPQIGGPTLTIQQFVSLMDRVTECIDECRKGTPAAITTSDTLGFSVGPGIRLNINRQTGRVRSLAMSNNYTLSERDIRKLVVVAKEIRQ